MMTKRLLDIFLSALAVLLVAPALLLVMLAIWARDGAAPLYRGVRIGKEAREFRMLKLRTMTPRAEIAGATSTAKSDARVTPLGQLLRRWKIDELPQFWNVLVGDMSLVGPRPNTWRGGVEHYTPAERRLLSVRPGITDLASIVFSDEGDILDGSADPDALYDRVIRPWKSQLGLLYVGHQSLWLDVRILWLTALALVSRRAALDGVARILSRYRADARLAEVCRRNRPLPAGSPPTTLTEIDECGFTY